MNYKDYKMIKTGNYCSVGMFGDNIYAFEYLTGICDAPVYIQITKAEFDNFDESKSPKDYGERKELCSAYRGHSDFDTSIVLTDDEIERKKIDKSLWRAGVYSKEYYDGQGVVVFDYTPYKLTKRAYEDVPLDTSLLSGFKNKKQGSLWQLAYEEIKCNKHQKGTYCETVRCNVCGNEFYFNDANIECPNCKTSLKYKK
jgi:hypothetical protein